MKSLLKILAGGFLAFMALAIVQEWRFFSSAWFGEAAAAPELAEADRRASADTLRLLLNVMGHFYRSGGDVRFAERMPAADWVVAEMQADVDYLARNGRVQELQLQDLEILSVDLLERDSVEIRTRETWGIEVRYITETEPLARRAQEIRSRYLLVRRSVGWRVEGWEVVEEEPASGETPS